MFCKQNGGEMKGVWKDEEVKALFGAVERSKSAGKKICLAFQEHAEKYSRKANSVRNYYYNEIERLKSDTERLNNLNIDLTLHNKMVKKYFSNYEKNEIIQKIKDLVNSGCSVRKACFLLSNGDVSTMLRYQNKFRAVELPKNNNILPFKKKTMKITDSDLQGLFMGLVRLIKKSAEEEISMKINQQIDREEEIERNLIAKLGQRERELAFLKDDNERLKKENANLKKQIMRKFCFEATKLNVENVKA